MAEVCASFPKVEFPRVELARGSLLWVGPFMIIPALATCPLDRASRRFLVTYLVG